MIKHLGAVALLQQLALFHHHDTVVVAPAERFCHFDIMGDGQ